ncbi:hypothetical protein NVP1121O_236 [Vibrio phage 1.121.O._10N.286.46.C4]|nr:hypothetical protein NVP1121O_236 [Vibrio phage 1.121.O._10N.286.46.C4]
MITICPSDLIISFTEGSYDSNSSWGARTFTGVMVYHKPTGFQTSNVTEKSVHRNKSLAIDKLRLKLEQEYPKDSSEDKLLNIFQIIEDYERKYGRPAHTVKLLEKIKEIISDT